MAASSQETESSGFDDYWTKASQLQSGNQPAEVTLYCEQNMQQLDPLIADLEYCDSTSECKKAHIKEGHQCAHRIFSVCRPEENATVYSGLLTTLNKNGADGPSVMNFVRLTPGLVFCGVPLLRWLDRKNRLNWSTMDPFLQLSFTHIECDPDSISNDTQFKLLRDELADFLPDFELSETARRRCRFSSPSSTFYIDFELHSRRERNPFTCLNIENIEYTGIMLRTVTSVHNLLLAKRAVAIGYCDRLSFCATRYCTDNVLKHHSERAKTWCKLGVAIPDSLFSGWTTPHSVEFIESVPPPPPSATLERFYRINPSTKEVDICFVYSFSQGRSIKPARVSGAKNGDDAGAAAASSE